MADPMNLSPALAGLTPQIWDDMFFKEYIRESQYSVLFGSDESAVIQLKDDLERRKGDRVTFAFINRLVGAGVMGHQVLRGNEEIINDRSMTIPVMPIRHAVALDNWTEQQSVIDKRNAAKYLLKDWISERMRTDIINSMMSVATNVTYAQATPAQQNAWVTNNADRILFGSKRSNTTGVGSTSMANLTAAAGKLDAATVSMARRQARLAHPRMRPYRLKSGTEWFLMYHHPLAIRDLRNDPVYRQDLQFAMERGKDNPLFAAGDLICDGVIIKEEPEFTVMTGAGGGGVDVAQGVLLGAQALGIAWALRTQTATEAYDYGFEHGVAIQEIRGIDKLRFGKGANDQDQLVDHGVFTLFNTATGDA